MSVEEKKSAEVSSSAPRETVNDLDQSYSAIVKRQFKKNRPAVWSMRFVYVIVFIGLCADFIANEKPLYCKYQGTTYFPVFKSYFVDLGMSKWPKELANVTWSDLEYESVIFPLIPYSPTNIDFANRDYASPFDEQQVKSKRWKHWMGTDKLGRDVLSGMVHGTRVAMLVGIISMSISTLLGIIIGSIAGYFGDNRLKMSRIRIILNIVFFVLAIFYAIAVQKGVILGVVVFFLVMALGNLIASGLKFLPWFGEKVDVAMDILISRFIEIFVSVPRLLLLLSVAAIIQKPSIYYIMMIIGATSWTGIARLIRGELLRVRNLEYIEAAQALGYSEFRTIARHAIPNSLTPVLIAVAFGVASAILLESFLSFLGIGVPADQVTWGSMLALARGYAKAWWLAIFPGFAIFITVTIFNLLGEGLTDALDPRLKQ